MADQKLNCESCWFYSTLFRHNTVACESFKHRAEVSSHPRTLSCALLPTCQGCLLTLSFDGKQLGHKRLAKKWTSRLGLKGTDLVQIHLLEPPLAVLALISDPSSVTDAGSVDAFSREAILVARFRRRGVSEEYKVKQDIKHQVSLDTSR